MVAASLCPGGRRGLGAPGGTVPRRIRPARPTRQPYPPRSKEGRGRDPEEASGGEPAEQQVEGGAQGRSSRGDASKAAAAEEKGDSISSRLGGVQKKLASLEKEMESIEEEFKQFERNSY